MSSSHFIMFSKLCCQTYFRCLRPMFQRFVMSYHNFYSYKDRLSLTSFSDSMFKFHTVNMPF